jgi:hypothetical protein
MPIGAGLPCAALCFVLVVVFLSSAAESRSNLPPCNQIRNFTETSKNL